MVLTDVITQELKKQGITVEAAIAKDKPVYSGRRKDGTSVILKTTTDAQKELKEQPNEREREAQRTLLENEFAMQQALGQHPNICRPYSLMKLPIGSEVHYILAISFVEGKPLENKHSDFYADKDGDHLYFKALRGAAEGLKHMHGKGILHLDIKPQNIMVDPQGIGVLIDFGSAKREGNTYPGILEGSAICTLPYAPPEQLIADETKKTDVYQLGATIFEGISCGEMYYLPVKDATGDVTKMIFSQPTKFPDANPSLRAYNDLRKMLEKARSLNSRKRPSIEDMCQMLKDHETYFRNHPNHERLLPYWREPITPSQRASTQTAIE